MAEREEVQEIDMVQRLMGNRAQRLYAGALVDYSRHWGILGARIIVYSLFF